MLYFWSVSAWRSGGWCVDIYITVYAERRLVQAMLSKTCQLPPPYREITPASLDVIYDLKYQGKAAIISTELFETKNVFS